MSALSTNFTSSRLVRLLGASTSRELEPPRADFAERVGQWLSAVDTVRLHAALPTVPVAELPEVMSPEAGRLLVGRLARLQAERDAVRQGLLDGFAAQAAEALRDAVHEVDAGHAPHRKRHQDQQRQMELRLGPLRATVRQALSQASPRLRQLALLDAALEQALGGREQRLMAAVPLLLERRFVALTQACPEGWHAAFVAEVQDMLHAELELRLQPLDGLMQALRRETEKHA